MSNKSTPESKARWQAARLWQAEDDEDHKVKNIYMVLSNAVKRGELANDADFPTMIEHLNNVYYTRRIKPGEWIEFVHAWDIGDYRIELSNHVESGQVQVWYQSQLLRHAVGGGLYILLALALNVISEHTKRLITE